LVFVFEEQQMKIELRLKPLADMDVMLCLLKSLKHFGATVALDLFDATEKRLMDALEATEIHPTRTVVTYAGGHEYLSAEYEPTALQKEQFKIGFSEPYVPEPHTAC
jgi:hypothetical protein